MNKTLLLSTTIALCATLGFAPEAKATDTYPGAQCQELSYGTDNFTRNGGKTENAGTISAKAICPMTNPYSSSGNVCVTVSYRNNDQGTLSCRVVSTTATSGSWGASQSTTANANGEFEFDTTFSGDRGYSVECTMPKRDVWYWNGIPFYTYASVNKYGWYTGGCLI